MFAIIEAAGWPIWPLIICSVVGLALVIERFVSLRSATVAPAGLVEEVMTVSRHAVPPADMVDKLATSSVLGSVLAAGFRALVVDPKLKEPALRQAFENAGRSALHDLHRYLNAIGTIASAAPLLGLLGTVIGMIEIFNAQSSGGGVGNPAQLAYGISVALYNTAFGLIVAIPALMCHRHFRSRVEAYQLGLELAAERMVPHLLRLGTGTRGIQAPLSAGSGAAAPRAPAR